MLSQNNKNYIRVIAAIVLLIFLHFTKILIPVETAIVKTFNPVLSVFYSSGSYLRGAYNKQTSNIDLSEEVKRLNNEVKRLTAENSRLKVLEDENRILREYLKFSKENKAGFVLANVIAHRGLNADNFNQSIIIDKGVRNGIKDGMAVLSEGIVVGKIVSSKNNISEVCLITGDGCKLAAAVQNINKTSGIIKGNMGLTIKMEFIPQTDKIKIGDTVVTSGLEKNIPRGLVIGKIVNISKENNKLWQNATIEPLVRLDELIIVSVLINR